MDRLILLANRHIITYTKAKKKDAPGGKQTFGLSKLGARTSPAGSGIGPASTWFTGGSIPASRRRVVDRRSPPGTSRLIGSIPSSAQRSMLAALRDPSGRPV